MANVGVSWKNYNSTICNIESNSEFNLSIMVRLVAFFSCLCRCERIL